MEVAVTLAPPGGRTLRIEEQVSSLTFTTNAMGGYGSCQLDLPGYRDLNQIPLLSRVTITYGDVVLYQGRIEDVNWSIGQDDSATSITCLGPSRYMTDRTVRQVFVARNLFNNFYDDLITQAGWAWTSGVYEVTDPTQYGLHFEGVNAANTAKNIAHNYPTIGGYLKRLLGTYYRGPSTSANVGLKIQAYGDSGLLGEHNLGTTAGDFDVDLAAIAGISTINKIRWQATVSGAYVPVSTDIINAYDMRYLGAFPYEDIKGGAFGGRIIRHLVNLVPEINPRKIEDGDDFLIQHLESVTTRRPILELLEETSSYYKRYWQIWEDGAFDWITPDFDTAHWVCGLRDLASLNLTSSVDLTHKTTYVLFQNAAIGSEPDESSATATSRTNPYVATGTEADSLYSPGFPMTTRSAQALANKVSDLLADYPALQGTITIPADAQIRTAAGTPLPAFLIRAGTNILIHDLPKNDSLLNTGRDGQTLFHIAATEANLTDRMVTLTLEGAPRHADVLLARLGFVTRRVSGQF